MKGKIWKSLRCVVPGKKKKSNILRIVTESGELTKPKEIVNGLNDYFANIGPKLPSKICNDNAMNSIPDPVCRNVNGNDLFAFNPVDDHYVLKQIKSFSKNKACGVDDICSKLLKSCAEEIASPLT